MSEDPRPLGIYVAATRQNDGKTTMSMGLLNALKEIVTNSGYIKPVGQQVRLIDGHRIDKDATLMDDLFHIGSHLQDMSPVAIPKGFTENFVSGGDDGSLPAKIRDAYLRESHGKQIMVVEGTGHAGVGSVIELSNADVASLLDVPVVIVTCGGIGKPIDEVTLNKALFDSRGVNVLGVIVNKVKEDKYEKIDKFVRMGFERKGIPVLGVLPFVPGLSSPTMRQLLEDTSAELISGEVSLDHAVDKILVGAMPPRAALDYFHGNVLLITPGTREDLILAAIASNMPSARPESTVKGMVLTGGVPPHDTILSLLKQSSIPCILVQEDTFSAARRITDLIIKIRPQDTDKVEQVKSVVKEYVDIDRLMAGMREHLTRVQ